MNKGSIVGRLCSDLIAKNRDINGLLYFAFYFTLLMNSLLSPNVTSNLALSHVTGVLSSITEVFSRGPMCIPDLTRRLLRVDQCDCFSSHPK